MVDAADRILRELAAHPTEKEGFARDDFDALTDQQRHLLVEPFFADLADGDATAVAPLQWLLGEQYVSCLESRLKSLPGGAPGLVFIPYWLYEATRDESYLARMMAEIMRSDASWARRRHAVGGYLRRAIGKSPVFWDFCRYLILHDSDPSMKKTALVWLAQEKEYGLVELTLDHRLANCLAGMTGPDAPTVEAMEILDAVHPDTGAFAASMERAKNDSTTTRRSDYSN
ncbi:hypothetical protein OU994_11415 [Pseudoduganella sp. SL102]|uniref:hypothetical protein n=1 Tax=Pseudoduganella sp. SL102 TaxID=2995154 RepID=UPI00248AA56C|nr:hypothetical protein [Pseudoduganella sp. SL102]WBS04831.1 hypothetical protein OU994_11415 [Pseudoduganella sp. SL102]